MSDLAELSQLPSWEWPEDAASRIRGALASADVDGQRRAAELAGDLAVMDEAMARALLELARSDAPADLRASGIRALGPAMEEAFEVGFDVELDESFDRRALGEPLVRDIQGVLRALHEDVATPQAVRCAALVASVRCPDDWHEAAVRAALTHPEPEWHEAALYCMGRIAGFEREILVALDSELPQLLVEAIRSAALGEVAAAGDRVLEFAADETLPHSVRSAAIEALGTLEPEGSAELLVSLTESVDDALAQLAFEALEERRVFSEPPDAPQSY